jgi:cytochrome c556
MSSTRPTLLAALAVCCCYASSAYAQGTPSKAEQALKYRKSVYQVIAWNFGPMAAMAQGKVPYDAREFQMRAERVAAVTPLLAEAYPAESRDVANSKLKPEMWTNRADFDSKLKDLVDRSAALATAARTGDFARSKAAFFETGNTCKACHDKYKAD